MKKTITILALFAIVVGTAFANGDEIKKNSQVKILPASEKTFKLIYLNPGTTEVKVLIKNENGRIVQKESIATTDGFMRPYNFTGMSDGLYTIEVKDGKDIYTETIHLKEVELMAVHQMENNRYRLFVEQRNQNPITVNVYDQKGDLIHTEEHQDDKGFTRVYDLKAVPSTSYTFELLGKSTVQRMTTD